MNDLIVLDGTCLLKLRTLSGFVRLTCKMLGKAGVGVGWEGEDQSSAWHKGVPKNWGYVPISS